MEGYSRPASGSRQLRTFLDAIDKLPSIMQRMQRLESLSITDVTGWPGHGGLFDSAYVKAILDALPQSLQNLELDIPHCRCFAVPIFALRWGD